MTGGRLAIAILVGVAAVLGCVELLMQFHDWNKEQACAAAGGRNCGGGPVRLLH